MVRSVVQLNYLLVVTGYKHPSTRITGMLWAHVASTLKIKEKRICTNQIFTWTFNIIRKHITHTHHDGMMKLEFGRRRT
jgi:hypothetical protein